LGYEAHWFQYNYGEWIYRERPNPNPALATGTDHGRVTVGDHRLTNVNGIVNEKTLKKDRNRGQINAVVQMVPTSSMSNTLVPRVFADLFLLAEVLWGGCNQAPYNLSVQTDVWEGKIPSSTAARLHSPNDDIKPIAQSIQKSTVLDPTGSLFNIPATTFQNINLKYREYIGVEIWKDNGFDNNIGMNIGETPPSLDLLYPNNLSDDYREGRTGEEFLGASSYFYPKKTLAEPYCLSQAMLNFMILTTMVMVAEKLFIAMLIKIMSCQLAISDLLTLPSPWEAMLFVTKLAPQYLPETQT
jgi:hypothetical protein